MEQQAIEVYEPPTMVEAGEFTEVTLGPVSRGIVDSYSYYRS
ncbi:lasso RiPP family leader peptide-containing protein [Streptomyces sp. NPDC003077]